MPEESWTINEVVECFQLEERFTKTLEDEEIICSSYLETTSTKVFTAIEVEKLRLAKTLVEDMGVNLAGVEVVLRMGSGIDLVILDMIMPGMDGGTTFDRIHELHPQMPVLLSSGYAADRQSLEILRKGCSGFIQKPFTMKELSAKEYWKKFIYRRD